RSLAREGPAPSDRDPRPAAPAGGGGGNGRREVSELEDPDTRSARRESHGDGQGEPARPGHRPGEGDRARYPDLEPAYEEQPGAHRRAWRRQDRDRREPGAQDREGRRGREAAEQGRFGRGYEDGAWGGEVR